jgi:hypothetical protein
VCVSQQRRTECWSAFAPTGTTRRLAVNADALCAQTWPVCVHTQSHAVID